MKLKQIEKLSQMAVDLHTTAMGQAPKRSREPDQVSQIDPMTDPVGCAWVEFLKTTSQDVVDAYALMNAQRRRLGMEPVAVPSTDGPSDGRPPAVGSRKPDHDPDEEGLGDFGDCLDDDFDDDDDTDDNSLTDDAPDTQEGHVALRQVDEQPRQSTIGGSDAPEVGPDRDRGF